MTSGDGGDMLVLMKLPPCPECGAPLTLRCAKFNVGYCRPCGKALRAPPPRAEELQEIYDKAYYHSWGDDHEAGQSSGDPRHPPSWNQKLLLFQRLLKGSPKPGETANALDIGCATGACLHVLQDLGWQALGIDLSPYAVEVARSLVPEAQIFQGAIEDLPPVNAGYGLIVLSDVLEHVTDPSQMMARVFDLLSSGGYVVVLTPDIESLSCRLMGSRWPHYKEEHPVLFGQTSLARLLAETGFMNVQVSPFFKPVSLTYAEQQFRVYRQPVLGAVTGLLRKILPSAISDRPFTLPMGEMCAVAHKPGS